MALFLGVADLTLVYLGWMSISEHRALGLSMLILTIAGAWCHAAMVSDVTFADRLGDHQELATVCETQAASFGKVSGSTTG
jgi:hypothetical protein